MDLAETFDQISIVMRADFEKARAAIESNPSLKGSAFEDTFRRFLRDYLPSAFDITTGIIVDSEGNKSKQIDVIITDAAKTPIFYKSESLRIVPIECVYAAIEIKAKLTADELVKANENMKSVKILKKKAFIHVQGPIIQKVQMYGKMFDIWPVNYYIFAYDSIDLFHIAQSLSDIYNVEKPPIEDRIDTICVLDKGVIANQLPDGSLNVTAELPAKITAAYTKRALLLFYTLMGSNLFHAELPKFHLHPYVEKVKW